MDITEAIDLPPPGKRVVLRRELRKRLYNSGFRYREPPSTLAQWQKFALVWASGVGGPSAMNRYARATRTINAACKYYGVTKESLDGSGRVALVVKVRHVLMYMLRSTGAYAYPEIGRRLGGRDHTTVIHGVKKISRLLADGDECLARDIAAIKEMIR